MGTKTFLIAEQMVTARAMLAGRDSSKISGYLDECLLGLLSAHPLWATVQPIALGSWARGELSAKSDIDLIFLGPEEKVKEFVDYYLARGIKIRYRVPEDRNDWSIGVQPFDVLALFSARSFSAEGEVLLLAQQQMIQERGAKYRRSLFTAMWDERKERNRRYDSITNYLEPNLKYGPGGLRDLEQGLMIEQIFLTQSNDEQRAVSEKLRFYKANLLFIRQWLHLNENGDVLSGHAQHEIVKALQYSSLLSFMSSVQLQLSEVSFFADWFAESARRTERKRQTYRSLQVEGLNEALRLLEKDPSVLMQEVLRRNLARFKRTKLDAKRFLTPTMDERFLEALFRSRLIELILPPVQRLRGHVQHDQYHRYSVDAHTLQAAREVLRFYKNPKRLGLLAQWVKRWRSADWEILFWSTLFHDLGKGLEGDHSTEGAKIVQNLSPHVGLTAERRDEVAWHVQNHLVISHAAFRQNPNLPSTWSELFKRGVQGARISQLTLLTAIDIRATNPEAWNDWKAQLLNQLCQSLHSPEASQLQSLLEKSKQLRVGMDKDFLERLDPLVIECVPHKYLVKDFGALKRKSAELEPIVVQDKKRRRWVRFHERVDRPGLFFWFCYQLHSLGLSVEQAFACTHPTYGAYDWFQVKTQKKTGVLAVQLKSLKKQLPVERVLAAESHHDVTFSVIEVVSTDKESTTLSFRGKDQRGALLKAAKMIYDSGLEIQSAKVHTWGRQIDDVFTVKSDSEGLAKLLK